MQRSSTMAVLSSEINDITVAGKLYAKTPKNGSGNGSVNAYDKNDKKAIITPKHNITFKQGSEAHSAVRLHACIS